jgi:PPK2 family polyphosphate:nucleotide phosphotransferase
MVELYRVKPGSKIKLDKTNANDKSIDYGSKAEAKENFHQLTQELSALQELLYAEHRHKLLVVLQGMDTSGKDSTIRHVFQFVDPLGVRVASLKAPTEEELDHDYLWRVHRRVPAKGEIVIFNRSHYEDVGVVRVHGLVPEAVWKRRFAQINDFERMLTEEGTTIAKFFLHIDLEEQKKRLQSRLDRPEKHWKFRCADLKERALWPQYMEAYEEAITQTSTKWAPWHVVPANRKWYRNLIVATTLVNTLNTLKMEYPAPDPGLADIVID